MDLTALSLTNILYGLLVIVLGPTVAYFAAKRMTEAKVRLIDIDAIKGWSEQRKSWEEEITQLHRELDTERDRRREDTEKYKKSLKKLEDKISELSKNLEKAQAAAEKYKTMLSEQSAEHAETEGYHSRIDDIQNQISTIILGGGDFNETLKQEVIVIRDNVLELRKELKEHCAE